MDGMEVKQKRKEIRIKRNEHLFGPGWPWAVLARKCHLANSHGACSFLHDGLPFPLKGRRGLTAADPDPALRPPNPQRKANKHRQTCNPSPPHPKKGETSKHTNKQLEPNACPSEQKMHLALPNPSCRAASSWAFFWAASFSFRGSLFEQTLFEVGGKANQQEHLSMWGCAMLSIQSFTFSDPNHLIALLTSPPLSMSAAHKRTSCPYSK